MYCVRTTQRESFGKDVHPMKVLQLHGLNVLQALKVLHAPRRYMKVLQIFLLVYSG